MKSSSPQSILSNLFNATFIFTISISLLGFTCARTPHNIKFRSPNLYPESLAWDPKSQHFIVGSLRHQILLSVSDAGVAETLISDSDLPANSSILGISIDTRHRLLAVIHSSPPLPSFNALAAYDLRSLRRLFLTPLLDDSTSSAVANDVTVDFSGNAYVTNSAGNLIWKVTPDGDPSILSRSPLFTSYFVEPNTPYQSCGLNGIVYISKGYLLVVQSNTGKLFKVNVDDGSARTVILNKELTAADGIAARRDGVLLVASQEKLYFVKSDDSWGEGLVFDETALEAEQFATSVTVGNEERVYVLYGHVNEGIMGNVDREEFRIVQVASARESEDDPVWIFVLLGLGLAYFMFWRFQMRKLAENMNKKRN